ncbi:hypothetical protein PIB30_016303 [Stylosanthes scabra]|uniref:Uncharacterized protein n=1 Tax=Stylosanthes scabra TaxID=79078 RepID=A0ABU6R7J6_9FABA|nr:hypothetical protein [Stylosanthes scabra]
MKLGPKTINDAHASVESDDEDWWDESEEFDESDEEDSKDEEEDWEVEEESRVEVEVEKEDMTNEVVEEEQVKEASKEEVEIVEEYGKLSLATVFEGEKVHKLILLVKCEDPGPCLVTCDVRGINIPECLCDSGACVSVMPYELYCLLDLGPLRTMMRIHLGEITRFQSIVDNWFEPRKHPGKVKLKSCAETHVIVSSPRYTWELALKTPKSTANPCCTWIWHVIREF